MTDDYEAIYKSVKDDLIGYFNVSRDDISDEDLKHSFPLMNGLKSAINHFIEHEEVACGGMKKIIRVTDSHTNRSVAKAVLLNDDCSDDTREHFLKEAFLTASLQHPNIISIYDIGLDENGSPYFIMELLKGDNLATILEKLKNNDPGYTTKYDLHALLEIFMRVCDAVAYAHSRNIIHLDLKPENIYISDFAQVHLCDWGLAKILKHDHAPEFDPEESWATQNYDIINHMTMNGELKGTPGFMAPEQVMPGAKKDVRTDIYSLGAILYGILTKELPVKGDTIKLLLDNTKSGLVVPPLNIPGIKVSERLGAIAMKALNKTPEQRYQRVDELRMDITNYLQGFATSAENAGFITLLILLVKRNKQIVALLSTFTCIIIIFTALSFSRINTERNVAEENLRLYKHEQEITEEQNRDIGDLLMTFVHSDSITNAREQIQVLGKALKVEQAKSDRIVILKKKGILHFLTQEFSAASKCLNEVSDLPDFNTLYKISLVFKKLKKDDCLLSDQQLADLIDALRFRFRHLAPMLYYYHMTREPEWERTPKSYLPLALAMLKVSNNHWKQGVKGFELEPFEDGYSLDLSHTQFRVLSLENGIPGILNILAPLKLRKLNLSYTPFFQFNQIRGLGITELDLTGCMISIINRKNFRFVKQTKLKRIVLDTENYDPAAIAALKKVCQVIEANP